FLLGTTVTGIRRGANDDFIITAQAKEFSAAQVIVATGGKAGPQYGSTGAGFTFARGFGLSVDMILPSLTMLKYGDDVLKKMSALKGVRVKANALLTVNGERAAESAGEVQFTDRALSGICIFDLSAAYNRYKIDEGVIREAAITLDLAPDMKESDIADLIARGGAAGLSGIVNDKLAAYIGGVSGASEREAKRVCAGGNDPENNANGESQANAAVQDPEDTSGDIGAEAGSFESGAEQRAEEAARIADTIKRFEVPVSGTGGWKEAQTTAGGVSTSELDEKHFESRTVPGLYFAGEVISSNMPCGGYNLDFAWNTGIITGARAAGFYNFSQSHDSGDQVTADR
ncbi:MAG: NAD(P)/FAD-dependent oxidoreductase, partial [Clostridiales Family XIII bacterium]|nr:NAD(P)/FAD-dependent oxidoreductase [Clostridiales Family XIII bacterium]